MPLFRGNRAEPGGNGHHFYKSGCLENAVIHGVDSTELPSEINYPLCTIEIKGKKVRIYSDMDCDCGKRRKKRDKSYYVIGCGTTPGECMFESRCPKSRVLAFDSGYFQPMPTFHQGSQESIEIRKNCERPFNLMKKREGLEQTRVRSQHGVVVRSALTTIVTLLLEMAGTRQTPQKKYNKQKELFAATG